MKLALILLLISNFAFAQVVPNYAKEKRWAAQVEDGLMDGEVVWLSANKQQFMSLYTPSETNTKRVAVIVHGLGLHPDWAQVIQPLRVALSEKGWHTLSIQMPVLANDKDAAQYMSLLTQADNRIKAAINYLQQQGLSADAIVSHSLGSVMSAHYLDNQQHPFKYFVAVGMPDLAVKYLGKIRIPILDLYGVDDIEPVLKSVKERAQAAKENIHYTQKKVNADHFFNDKDALLIDEVGSWLK
jgi:alpha/beta superfamily hydrolase